MAGALSEVDARTFIHANWRLQEQIVAVNPSPLLRSIYLTLLEITRDYTLDALPAEDRTLAKAMADRYRIHAGLVDAIENRDAAALDWLVREHGATTTS